MTPDFTKMNDLVPAIIQHAHNRQVLMLGYMSEGAFAQMRATKKVHFYSRSKKRIWMKGESSGNILTYVDHQLDCDQDALLIRAIPSGPTCHTGSYSCFGASYGNFLAELEQIIAGRISAPDAASYTSSLVKKGINKIAQKVGEEAVELVIEAVADNRERLQEETADLLYHLLVLLQYRDLSIQDIESVLRKRHKTVE